VRERGAELDREHACPQQLRVVERPVRLEERRSALGRHEAPEERQVDGGIGAADVAPVDHAAHRATVDEHVTEVEVAVDEDGLLGRREPLGLGEKLVDARRRAPAAEPLDLAELFPRERCSPGHVRAAVGVERQRHVELDRVELA
jgi:hypothetical protein